MIVKFKSHIFKESTESLVIDSTNTTINDFIHLIPEKYDRELLHVQVNDEVVSEWDKELKEDDIVLITFVPAGGGDNNKVLATIVSLALMSFAPGFGARTAAGWGLTGSSATIVGGLVSAGFTYVASLVVNAVFPPSTNRNAQLVGADPAESAVLSIQGARNALKPYNPCIVLYGEHKVTPPLCAESYTVHKGDDTYLCMLFDCGYGDVNLYDMRFGEDKFLNAYDDIEIAIHKDLHTTGELEIYTNDVGQEDYALLCKYNVPEIVTTETDTDKAILDISFLKGLVSFTDQGNRANRSVTFDIEYRASGDVTWLSFQNNQISFTSDAVNSNDYEAIFFLPNYDEIKYLFPDRYNWGYKAGATEIHIASKGYAPQVGDVIYFSNFSFIIDGSVTHVGGDYYKVTFNIGIPFDLVCEFYQTYNYTYNLGGSYIDYSGLEQNRFAYLSGSNIKIREGGTDIREVEVTKATMQNFVAGIEMKFPTSGQYEIRVTRTTADSDSTRIFDEMTITALRSIRNRKPLELDHQRTILEMKVKATDQLSGVIDDFNFVGKRVLPVYNGTTWSNEETSNPAWIVYQILTGGEAPRPVDSSKLSLSSFYTFAQWCDQLNEDGNPKFTTNLLVDYSTTVRELINNILSSARASISQTDNEYGIIIDTVKSSVGLITPRNSWGFSGNRTFMDQPHALKTTFIDKDANYEIREIMVYADGYDANNATRIQNFDTFAVTDYKQAWSLARYFIAQGIHRSNIISFDMDIENIIFTRGDVFDYQNDIIRKGGTSARIMAHNVVLSKSQIQLDTDIEGTPTGIVVRTADGSLITAGVTQISTDTLECDVEITGIEKYDLVAYGTLDSETSKYLVKSINYKGDMVATIEAVDYAPQIFAADTGTIPAYDSGAVFNNSNTPPDYVRDVVVNQDIQYKDRYPFISVSLNWKPAQNSFPKAFEIYTFKDNRWKLVDVVYNPPYLFIDSIKQADLDIVGKILRFKVLAVSANGLKKDLNQAQEIKFKVVKDNIAPWYVTNHKWTTEGDRLKLTWTNPSDVDFDGVEIRRQSDGRAWSDSQIVYRSSYLENSCLLDPVEGKYYLRSVDTSGNYSEAIAEVDVVFVAPVISNLSARIDGDKIFLQFDKDSGSFDIKEYDVYFNNENQVYKTYDTEKIYLPAVTDGDLSISLIARNVLNVESTKINTTVKTYLYQEYELYQNSPSNIGAVGFNNLTRTISGIQSTPNYYQPNYFAEYSGGFNSIKEMYNAGLKSINTVAPMEVYAEAYRGYNILNLLVEVTISGVSDDVVFFFEGSASDDTGDWSALLEGENLAESKASGLNKFLVKNRYAYRVLVERARINSETLPTFTVKTYGKIEEETGREINIPATGTVGATITYQYKYAGSTADYTDNTPVAIIENGNAGDYIVFSNQTETTVDVSLFDVTNTRISGTINWTKRGIRKG